MGKKNDDYQGGHVGKHGKNLKGDWTHDRDSGTDKDKSGYDGKGRPAPRHGRIRGDNNENK